MNHETIARRAYSLWEQSGRPDGRDLEYWLKAESLLRAEERSRAAVTETVRTSDDIATAGMAPEDPEAVRLGNSPTILPGRVPRLDRDDVDDR
jgi:hypothetical protein